MERCIKSQSKHRGPNTDKMSACIYCRRTPYFNLSHSLWFGRIVVFCLCYDCPAAFLMLYAHMPELFLVDDLFSEFRAFHSALSCISSYCSAPWASVLAASYLLSLSICSSCFRPSTYPDSRVLCWCSIRACIP